MECETIHKKQVFPEGSEIVNLDQAEVKPVDEGSLLVKNKPSNSPYSEIQQKVRRLKDGECLILPCESGKELKLARELRTGVRIAGVKAGDKSVVLTKKALD